MPPILQDYSSTKTIQQQFRSICGDIGKWGAGQFERKRPTSGCGAHTKKSGVEISFRYCRITLARTYLMNAVPALLLRSVSRILARLHEPLLIRG
jgi:hypothetical protein